MLFLPKKVFESFLRNVLFSLVSCRMLHGIYLNKNVKHK